MALSPGTRLGPYEVTAKIGQGGMGEVYKATDTRLGRTVAIKLLPPDFAHDQDRRTRFEREARAISKLNHPNICTLYDIGEHEGQPFLVMEVIRGLTLQERLRGRPLKTVDVLDLAAQLADALDVAHAEGIIHRDIKPENIIVTARGQAKLLDFGLAKQAPERRALSDAGERFDAPTMPPEQLTEPGSAVGTVSYMSPEQARGETLDQRTDLFSLGAVLYEMVTGRQAFEGPTAAVVFDQILNQAPVAPVHLDPDVPPKLQDVISNALEKDRELRYQHAADLRADLKRVKRDLESGRSATVSVATATGVARGGTAVSSQALPPGPRKVADEAWPATAPSQSAIDQMSPTMPAARARRTWLFLGGAAALIAVLLVALLGPRSGEQDATTVAEIGELADALARSQLALATTNLASKNYAGAIATADVVLATAAGHPEATRIRNEARAALRDVERLLGEARRSLEDGNTQQAGEAVASALQINPSDSMGQQLQAVLNAAAAGRTEPVRQERSTAPPAAAPAPQPAVAPEPPTDRPTTRPPPVAVPVVPVPQTAEPTAATRTEVDITPATAQPAAPVVPAVRPGAVDTPDSTPIVPESRPALAPDDQAAIRRVITTYERAIESQDIDLFRSVVPGLSGEEVERIRASFADLESQQVEITVLSVDVQGNRAFVHLARTDTFMSGGNQQTQASEQSITLARSGDAWTIAELGQ